jgi:putative peptide zinc metalloprotease protein
MVDQASRLDQLISSTPLTNDVQSVGPRIPDRPKLAENIELLGEMKESAFAEPPWLASRNGKFLQITKLVHRVAENATGDNTAGEIAEAVSANYERQVDAVEVRQLVANSLIPAGIVVGPDGNVPAQTSDGPSPLAVNMKMKMLSPAFINIFTGILKVFYFPPVLIAMLGAALATQYWLFFIHGIGGSVHDAFYTSGLMLAVLGIVVASAAFHEFGHASALTYGGGRVGGMGAGVYIVYPAFYTDVTDNYRLARWARVRTDLGGFYFNLIFGLALTALYFATGQEVFLIGIAIVDFEIIHQLLPFVRLDGYWALADITGIPDFFSQIAPFMRSHLPAWMPFPEGRRLPRLKTWAKLFFSAYILVTIPLLIFLFFLMFKTLPRIIATGASAFWEQGGNLVTAAGDGAILTIIASALQMILLLLPSIGVSVLFARLALKFLRAVWDWSKPTFARRVTGALVTSAAVAFFAFLWLPQIGGLPNFGPSSNSVVAIGPFEPIRPNEKLTVPQVVRGGPPPPIGPADENRQRDGAAPALLPETGTATPGPVTSATVAATPLITTTPGTASTAVVTSTTVATTPVASLTPRVTSTRAISTPTPTSTPRTSP